MECHNPGDPRQGVDFLTVNQQTIWSSPSNQSREGGGNWLSVKLAIGKLSSGAQILWRMFSLALYVLQHWLVKSFMSCECRKMNGKILILLIKLNKSSLEFPLVLFFLITAEYKACWCPYRDSQSALDSTSFGQKPQEKEAHDEWKGALLCPWETSFFCTDPPHGSCFSRV